MNFSLLLFTLIICILNHVICDSKSLIDASDLRYYEKSPKDSLDKQIKLLKYFDDRQPDLEGLLPRPSSSDYYICKRTYPNTYEPVDYLNFAYSYDQDLRRPKRNRMSSFQQEDELLPKPARKSDDPKVFRNLFLGSRG